VRIEIRRFGFFRKASWIVDIWTICF
jgi:hypothetical protein